jgi:hypothetical protein
VITASVIVLTPPFQVNFEPVASGLDQTLISVGNGEDEVRNGIELDRVVEAEAVP